MVRLELKGTPVAPGVGVGPCFVVVETTQEKVPRRDVSEDQVEVALEHFEQARVHTMDKLREIQEVTSRELGEGDAAIYGAQIAVLQDPSALDAIRQMVRQELVAPESAIQAVVDKFEALFESLEGGEIKNWAADLRDPWYAVIRELNLEEEELLAVGEGRMVLVAPELTPGLVARHRNHPLAGILTARGGRFSHGAVLARAFGIPTVIGLEAVHAKARNGEPCVVYGDDGRVFLGAEARLREEADAYARDRAAIQASLNAAAGRPCEMTCGRTIQVLANIESLRDLEMFEPSHTDGVGLFRTEFAYMERPVFPGEKEQTELYRNVLEHFPDKPVVFRTLDIGGDKQLRYFQTPVESNPVLGWRGLRVSLEWKDLFLIQLKALVNARQQGDVRVMLPMVTTVEEVKEVKNMLDTLRADAKDSVRRVPLGIMLEVPAAAMALEDLAAEVEFVSVGTNDLTQYLFAVDRDNALVSKLYQPFHPAHLRVLRIVARTCDLLGKNLSVCGEMAGQLAGALYLVGAGYRSLSMAPPFIPEVKAVLRLASFHELSRLAKEARSCSTAGEAHKLLEEAAATYWRQVVRDAGTSRETSGAAP